MKSYNFGNGFLRWIEILYNGAESCVLNNGFSTGWFSLHAGLRQGCPLSPALFVLAVEKLADCIRREQDIKDIQFEIEGSEYKISQYADDSTLFIKTGESLQKALDTLDDFSKFSGLVLNYDKSIGMNIRNKVSLKSKGKDIQWVDKFDVLGLNFYRDNREVHYMAWEMTGYMDKMKEITMKWGKRKISLKGKVTVLNVLVFPMIY